MDYIIKQIDSSEILPTCLSPIIADYALEYTDREFILDILFVEHFNVCDKKFKRFLFYIPTFLSEHPRLTNGLFLRYLHDRDLALYLKRLL
jgi:hypothetical protein